MINELKKASFAITRVTRFNILFFKGNQYIVLCFKQSKTDIKHNGIQIILVATEKKIYPITTLVCLYTLDPQPANAPIFFLLSSFYSRFNVMMTLKKQLSLTNLELANYFSHNFRKSMAQHTIAHCMLAKIIQKPGR